MILKSIGLRTKSWHNEIPAGSHSVQCLLILFSLRFVQKCLRHCLTDKCIMNSNTSMRFFFPWTSCSDVWLEYVWWVRGQIKATADSFMERPQALLLSWGIMWLTPAFWPMSGGLFLVSHLEVFAGIGTYHPLTQVMTLSVGNYGFIEPTQPDHMIACPLSNTV